MLETFDGSGGRDAPKGWRGARGKLTRHEVRSPENPAMPASGPFARMAFPEVLQVVYLRDAGLDPSLPHDPRRLNERLLSVMAACHEIDSCRRRLLSSLNTLQTLQGVTQVLVARVEAGFSTPGEPTRLGMMMEEARRSVEVATAMWEMAAPYFTRVTRLFPAQLEVNGVRFAPMETAEIDRLAIASRGSPHDMRPEQSWGARSRHLDALYGGESDPFAQARGMYLQAVTEWELAEVMMVRARRTRDRAEAHFRVGTRSVLEFAEALVTEDRQRSSLITRTAHASMKRHALYALAQLLPEQFGCG